MYTVVLVHKDFKCRFVSTYMYSNQFVSSTVYTLQLDSVWLGVLGSTFANFLLTMCLYGIALRLHSGVGIYPPHNQLQAIGHRETRCLSRSKEFIIHAWVGNPLERAWQWSRSPHLPLFVRASLITERLNFDITCHRTTTVPSIEFHFICIARKQ